MKAARKLNSALMGVRDTNGVPDAKGPVTLQFVLASLMNIAKHKENPLKHEACVYVIIPGLEPVPVNSIGFSADEHGAVIEINLDLSDFPVLSEIGEY